MYRIVTIKQQPEYRETGIAYFQQKWASPESLKVYEDAITRSIATSSPLPRWYLLLKDDEIVGCCGLINNDFISCSDLYPWLCALYIEKEHRGQGCAKLLIDHVKKEAQSLGFSALYLSTDLENYYQRHGFVYLCDGYHPWGETSNVYGFTFEDKKL